MKKYKSFLLSLLTLLPLLSTAQDEAESLSSMFEFSLLEIVLGFAVFVAIVCVIAMFTILSVMRTVIKLQKGQLPAQEKEKVVAKPELIVAKPGEEGETFWGLLWNRVNAFVPVSQEATVETEHEYDGIRELDNRLPPWWLYGFYATIVFGAIYLVRFYFFDMPSQDQEFQLAMQEADEEVQAYLASLDNLIDENSVVLSLETADLDAGKALFQNNCSVCHAADGGGGVGPNLTDKYWLHGGDIKSIFKTIKYGIPSKGMIAWETQLSPKKMQQVSSYIYQMEGTIPAKAKEPQGDFEEREVPVEGSETPDNAEKEEVISSAEDKNEMPMLVQAQLN
ncbi:MAG: cbb3-type cytochrome c oxidase N-terminal domain-containing protein [Bacteroidota bacterium]